MRVLTEEGLQKLEDKFSNARVVSDRTQYKIKINFSSLLELSKAKELIKSKQVEYEVQGNYLIFTQTDALKLFSEGEVMQFSLEERVWPTAGGELVPTSEMDHQRLSNCIGLLEILLTKNKITKESADIYIKRLEDSVVPEIQERFSGHVLPYVPHYEWEKKLVNE